MAGVHPSRGCAVAARDAHHAAVDYASPECSRGYLDGLNGRPPDPGGMRQPSYAEGHPMGTAEQECPLEYRVPEDDGT